MEILGIDVGGTGIKGAIVDTEVGELISDRIRIKTPQPSLPGAVIKTIARIVRKFDYHGPIGVGFPAVVMDGIVLSAANVDKSWIGYPGQEKISEATGEQVTLLNDADAAGIAEVHFGAGKGQTGTIIILTLGTGIGSALFVDGRLVPNTEMGHLYLKGHKLDAETYASERARVVEALAWDSWAARLNEYLQHIEMLFTPKLFILGGGVSKKHRKFVPFLDVRASIIPAVLRNQAGIIGAAMGAVESMHQ